jgi:hypothetical protein
MYLNKTQLFFLLPMQCQSSDVSMDDAVDMMACQYSMKHARRRWKLAVFDDIVDMTAINAYILSTTLFPSNKKKRARKYFLINLARDG